ncbi:MAG: amidohydrolase family protein [Acidobacteria bacterium]|nr:amidohydrolase family protein [Acidobacteriota bacterium]
MKTGSVWRSIFVAGAICAAPVFPVLPAIAAGQPPDIVFVNGKVVTMDDATPAATALAVRGDTILTVGSDAEIRALAGPPTRVIDLGGKALLPGFVEAHTHLLNDAEMAGMSWEEAQELGLQSGVTTMADMYVDPDILAAMQQFERDGKLRLRTSLYLVYTTNCGVVLGDWYAAHPPTRTPGEMLRIGGVKMFADGGSCGDPAFSFQYPDSESYGDLFLSESELTKAVAAADQRGYQVAIHAYGDRAVETAQNAIAAVLDGGPNVNRHRMEHNVLVRPELVARYGQIGIVPVIFGYFPTCWEDSDQIWEHYVGAERLSWVRDNRSLLDANPGLTFAWHADFPWVGPVSAIQNLYEFVTRKQLDEDGVTVCEPPDWVMPTAVTVAEALRMMTMGSAYALFRETEVGSLSPGKYADLVVLSADPLEVDSSEIKDIDVLMTMVGGSEEYCAPGETSLCLDGSVNLTLGKLVTASSSLAASPPEQALDGNLDTSWQSGEDPVQWIEVDLGRPSVVTNIKLVTDQYPHGDTRHAIWGKGAGASDEYQLLHEFTRHTTSGQVLSFTPPEPWRAIRFVKVETTSSPSWVAWKEIEIRGRPAPKARRPAARVAPG